MCRQKCSDHKYILFNLYSVVKKMFVCPFTFTEISYANSWFLARRQTRVCGLASLSPVRGARCPFEWFLETVRLGTCVTILWCWFPACFLLWAVAWLLWPFAFATLVGSVSCRTCPRVHASMDKGLTVAQTCAAEVCVVRFLESASFLIP